MRAVRYHEHGDTDVFVLEDVSTPDPDRDEVLVAIHAAGVNPIDTYIRAGSPPPVGGLPHVGGADMAGTVEEVGSEVEGFEVGDRVFATGLGLFGPGTYAEYVAAPPDQLASLPASVSFETGAAGAMVFATAWRALVTRGDLSVGDVALIHGASGGVGHAGIQIAREAGATVIGTASPGKSTDLVRKLGADEVLDYAADDIPTKIRDVTDEDGVDVVLESHAGANIETDLEVLKRGGRITVIGEEEPIQIDQPLSLTAKIGDADLRFMSIMASAEDQASILRKVGPRLADGTFDVIIEETYPLEEVATAQEHMMSSGVDGKIVINTTE